MGGGPDSQFLPLQRNGAIDLAVNLQGFGAGDLPFDMQAGTQSRRIARRRAARARIRCRIEWHDWSCQTLRGRNRRRFSGSLRLGPHKTSLFRFPTMTIAPNLTEQRGLTLIPGCRRGNPEVLPDCAL